MQQTQFRRLLGHLIILQQHSYPTPSQKYPLFFKSMRWSLPYLIAQITTSFRLSQSPWRKSQFSKEPLSPRHLSTILAKHARTALATRISTSMAPQLSQMGLSPLPSLQLQMPLHKPSKSRISSPGTPNTLTPSLWPCRMASHQRTSPIWWSSFQSITQLA
jgi:hypothetical protein